MADIDGQWDSVAKSPMGDQASVMTISTGSDGSFSGSSDGPMGLAEISDGTVSSDKVSWKVKVSKPFPMTLTVTGTINGDSIAGTIDTGAFGKFPMTATRKT